VPPNTTATVHLPWADGDKITLNGRGLTGSVHELTAGVYRFVVG
jgi:hypothetical protein